MRKYTFYLLTNLWILIFMFQNATANCGAGTVLYFSVKGKIYLLLADHRLPLQRQRGWSGFGGLCDGQPAKVAAARETEEETKGYYNRREILAALETCPVIRIGDFTTFFVKVDYVPAAVFNNQKPPGTASGYLERGPYAWIPYAVIRQAVDSRQAGRTFIPGKYLPADALTDWFFEPFLTSLITAEKDGILPWIR